jgi:hypothetical protein
VLSKSATDLRAGPEVSRAFDDVNGWRGNRRIQRRVIDPADQVGPDRDTIDKHARDFPAMLAETREHLEAEDEAEAHRPTRL